MRERIRDLGRLEHMLEHIDRANIGSWILLHPNADCI